MGREPKFKLYLYVILFFCTALFLLICFKFKMGENKLQYYRLKDNLDYTIHSLPLMQTMVDVISQSMKKAARYEDANFVLFETLNTVDSLLSKARFPKGIQYIYGVRGTDLLASKSMLAVILKSRLPDGLCDMYMPHTYILENGRDKNLLIAEFDPHKIYILKKNIQRQEGNSLTNKLDDIIGVASEVVVAQVMLQDPYLVNGRKINLRMYLLVVVDADDLVTMYTYNNGFLYYTPQHFKQNTLEMKYCITTGYIDRSVYAGNPLDFPDLQKYMDTHGDSYSSLMHNAYDMLRNIGFVYKSILEQQNRGLPGKKFLIYGCDIAPDSSLQVKLMEINKGPDLSYKDERDKQVKYGMLKEAFGIVGINNSKRIAHNFIKLI
jgi:hypothetical protein